MRGRFWAGLVSVSTVTLAVWLGQAASEREQPPVWEPVVAGVLRTSRPPHGYALLHGEEALLIDAPAAAATPPPGVRRVHAVLLTHHHRDTCAAVPTYRQRGVTVQAPEKAAPWLTPDGVAQYWQESLPLRNSRTAYLVVPEGVLTAGQCCLQDQDAFDWHDWRLRVLATPGHTPDHVAFVARKGEDGPTLVFCGDAFCLPGKLWTPYTTDWDHWTDAGLKPAAQSLRQLADLAPAYLLPAHGPVRTRGCREALLQTAEAVGEVAFLKSFERYTRQRLGNAPHYRFLAPDQVASAGEKPWTQVSEHLFLTGNTYVLVSRDQAFLVLDPWGRRSADQVARLAAQRGPGPLEVVVFSHAHYDHYDGVYDLPHRDRWQVWTLDRVAEPLAEPFLLRAPFLDRRPVRIDRRLADGETVSWREYRFRVHHLPGQSDFTLGLETVIDGRKCFFTADNFFHQDQFSGTGGWMGLNRSYPLPYAASARKVLEAAPDWVLAEHGGPFEFNAEDFRRRIAWGEACARAADAVSPSGNHRVDWDPHRIHVRPVLQQARPGQTLTVMLHVNNAAVHDRQLRLEFDGRGRIEVEPCDLEVAAGLTRVVTISLRVADNCPAGRLVVPIREATRQASSEADAFFALDVAR